MSSLCSPYSPSFLLSPTFHIPLCSSIFTHRTIPFLVLLLSLLNSLCLIFILPLLTLLHLLHLSLLFSFLLYHTSLLLSSLLSPPHSILDLSCWLRVDTSLFYGQIIPIVALVTLTFTLIEAAGSADYKPLKGIFDEVQERYGRKSRFKI